MDEREKSRKKIFNKNLGISEDDVKSETSMKRLIEWRFDLYAQMESMVAGVDDARELSQNVFVYYRYTKALYKMVRARISDIREHERHYCRQFEEVAAEMLDYDVYTRISEEAVGRVNIHNEAFIDANEAELNDTEL